MSITTRGAFLMLPVALVSLFVSFFGGGSGIPYQDSGSSSSSAVSLHPPLEATVPVAGVDESWWHTVSAGLARQEYEATPGERGLEAPNRAQNLRTLFTPQGIEVGPRGSARVAEDSAWRFGWVTTSLGRPGQTTEAMPAVVESEGTRVTYTRPGWSEWYENTAAGLEQGFTISTRPSGEGPLQVTGALETELQVELSDGVVDFFDAQGARVLRYGKLVANDAEGRLLPSALAQKDRSLIIEVDDSGAAYPITIDPLMTSPAWTAEGNQIFARFGCSVATAGDVNGDGFSDVVVGAYGYDNGQEDEGRAFLYYGSSNGLSASPAWITESNLSRAELGYSVAAAGDVNGDGYGDVVIGARGYTMIEASAGRALVYHGSPSGLSASPAWFFDGDQNSGGTGMSVAGAGDVNGDGFSDVVVGAPWYNSPGSEQGKAYLFHGSAAGLAAAPAWVRSGAMAEALFGYSVATAGDVNADGYSDVIIGAMGYSNGQDSEGQALVYHGTTSGLSGTPAWTSESNQTYALFGASVATAGDTNGDGFADVIVGSPQFDGSAGDNSGRAVIHYGSASGLSPAPGWIGDAFQGGAWFGISVATAGDVNGDGYADVIVGACNYDNGEENEGRAFVYYGYPGGIPSSPSWTAETNQVDGGFLDWNFNVATVGDVNGDGFSDVAFGTSVYDGDELTEGRAFLYHGGADGLPPLPAWFTNGGQTGAGWGWSVATAGDVNADGYSDIIVTALFYDSGQVDEGKAWAYHGSPSGVPLAPAWSAETNQVGALLTSATSAGDVNGDGYSDVILASYGYDNGQTDEGRTFLYLGSASGLGATPVWISEPDQAGASFGYSVGSAGDVNGDGFGDVVVGAPDYDNGQNGEGRAYLYLGSAGGLAGPTWSLEGDQDGAQLGYSVGTAGDVNGDGYSDVLISLPAYDQGESNEGVVWVFHGSVAGLGTSPSRVLEANQADATFGIRVATAGDVNGDGFSDVIVGANGYDNGQSEEGRAFVYHGGTSGLSSVPAWTTESDQTLAKLGWSVATAGDVNGDGYSDVVVGAHFYDYTVSNEGKVWLYHGSPTGLGSPVWSTQGGQAGAVFGISVGTAGDVNGDGFSDVIIGAADFDYAFNNEGGVWIWFGNSGDGVTRIRRQTRTDTLGPIDILGRSNSTSAFRLQALCRTAAGRARVRLEIEARPTNTPFDGTDLVSGPLVQTSFPTSDGSTVSLSEVVTGLVPATLYHWRLRIASDSPFFPHSPWLWLAGNGSSEGDVRTGGSPSGIEDDLSELGAGALLGAPTPNPFTGSTAITFALPHDAPVRLGVFDLQGRLLASLVEGSHRAGLHQVRWNGEDADGKQLPAGVYFARLEFEGHIEAQKLILAR